MYHCQLQIYLAGHGPEALGILKRLPPSPGFSHSFTESREPDPSLAADAGLILADVQGQDALAAVQALLRAKAPEAECIVIASREQAGLLEEVLDGLADLWTGPLSGAELRFRFQRWQRERKLRADAWETHQFLEATINSVPNLIWYKDKNGI
ncbi:MAG: hybrid sensor histidine kinase/response regulator, partial [Eubacteriales bacterium]|nr:hybrid sensor histidine kinase/response regulator [Eubacteriales bacterium]